MHTMPILTVEAAEGLLKALDEYLENSEASFALVIDRGGAILTQHGQIPPSTDPTVFAALAAGSFAATRELALRIGETEFSALHQQGKHSHILITSINDDAVLVSVFGPKTTLGLVRFYAVGTAKRIAVVLEQACQASQIPIDLDSEVINASWEVFQEPSNRD